MTAGVPAPFDPTIAAAILDALAAGDTLPTAAKAQGLSAETVRKWARFNPSFRTAAELARAESGDAILDDYRDRMRAGDMDAKQAHAEGNFLHWYVPTISPRHRVTQKVEIATVDASTAMIEARKRTSLVAQAYPAMLEQAQDTEYTELLPSPTTDNESAAPAIDPFS